MKILIISPAGFLYEKGEHFVRLMRYAPLSITTLASLVPKELNAKIRLIDEVVEKTDYSKLNPDLVAISILTPAAEKGYILADYFRKRNIPVVLGGVHPTLMPEEAKQHADAIVLGYGEETWPKLLMDFKNGKMKKVYRTSKDFSLDKKVIVNRSLLKPYSYVLKNTIESSRGCNNHCNFCTISSAYGNHLSKPLDNVINEIKALKGKTFVFIDSNLNVNKEYSYKLFKRIKPLKKLWGGSSTISDLQNEKLLDSMAESGCRGVLIGFETVNQDSLDFANKGFNNVENYKKIIQKIKKRGLLITGTFILGIDSDKKDIFDKTIKFVNNSGIDIPVFMIYTPFPGTPLFKNIESEGRIIEKSWSLYDFNHVVFKPKNMSAEELQEGIRKVWKNVYSHKNILKRLSHSGRNFPISLLANYGYWNFSRNFSKYTPKVIKKMKNKYAERLRIKNKNKF